MSPARRTRQREGHDRSNLVALGWRGSDEALLERAGRDPNAAAALVCERFGRQINRLVWSLLGPDPAHDDVVHDVYVSLLAGLRRVRDPAKLQAWVYSVTVRTVRWELRKRSLRRRRYLSRADLSDQAGDRAPDHEGRRQLRRLFCIIEQLSVEQRLAFALRHIDQQPLPRVAEMSGCSLTTVKRRLARAERRFTRLASRDEGLRERLERGKWKGR